MAKGCDSTAGMTYNANSPCADDCPAIKELVSLGAVPFCQTNVPQTMYTIQCSNPVYGETGNSFDARRECGGSSGGEGSLIGAGGSILGVGSDTGGSLRNPAALCGIYSLKPTFGRHLSQLSVRSPIPNAITVHPTVVGGFMSSSASGLATAYKAAWSIRHVDASLIPMKFDDEKFGSERY